jgi:hypothetical protein
MNGHPTNEDREALIAGERAGHLAPGEVGELSLLADLLGDPSTWAEPATGLEDTIVQAVGDAAPVAGNESVPSCSMRTGCRSCRPAATTKRG